MVWTVLGFVPWIIYWVLTGMGNTRAAILAGLGFSLALNVYRFARRKVKILDAVSLAFLAISAFVTFVLGSDLLASYGGVLSDLTLASVAWGSLLAGNPFTLDYAKEDWDQAFWDNPIFVETNQIITAVWGGVFTVQMLLEGMAMMADLQGAARLVLVAVGPRALLAVAVFFSAWFPRWYPQRAAARRGGEAAAAPLAAGSRERAVGAADGPAGLRLIASMPLGFDAGAAGDMQATIQFRLSGEGGGAGYLEIGSGNCAYHPGEVDRPTLTIESPAEVWTAISRGEMSGTEALLNGHYQASGDLSVLMRLGSLFGAPESA